MFVPMTFTCSSLCAPPARPPHPGSVQITDHVSAPPSPPPPQWGTVQLQFKACSSHHNRCASCARRYFYCSRSDAWWNQICSLQQSGATRNWSGLKSKVRHVQGPPLCSATSGSRGQRRLLQHEPDFEAELQRWRVLREGTREIPLMSLKLVWEQGRCFNTSAGDGLVNAACQWTTEHR